MHTCIPAHERTCPRTHAQMVDTRTQARLEMEKKRDDALEHLVNLMAQRQADASADPEVPFHFFHVCMHNHARARTHTHTHTHTGALR